MLLFYCFTALTHCFTALTHCFSALTHIHYICLLYTSDAADERSSVDLGGRRIIKKKKKKNFFFFFQAEDGIRDAQESRGLGDVYKRQALTHCFSALTHIHY